MRRLAVVTAVLSLTALGWLAPSAQAAPDPTRTLTVTGTGVTTYPAFAAGTTRYAATTTDETGGSLQVTATTSDLEGTVLVNGRLATGPTTVDGLAAGDEVSVIIDDDGGRTSYAVVYLPAGFPTLAAINQPGVAPGLVALTLNTFGSPAGQPAFETIVDRNGVPAYVAGTSSSTLDLKKQPNGELTLSRPTTVSGKTGTSLVTLGADLGETARRDTVGLVNTDNHDGERLPDGSTVLIGYEPNSGTGKTDATIQKLDANGDPVFTWDSSDYVTETVAAETNPDYAHINSIQTVGEHHDVLASFRHLSSVFLIATEAHDGYQPGDVIWKLGGRASTFTFPDDPDGGPCAQHTATMLANGNVLVYDNGGNAIGANPSLCVDPADRTGPTINRARTRVTEYALDLQNDTASLVWSYDPESKFALFAGSARRLSNGNTLIGWASDRAVMATEVNAAEETVWELAVPGQTSSSGYVTYRAALIDELPDAIDPGVEVTSPANGASFLQGQVVAADFGCTDRGGSNLDTCTGAATLDTSTPGSHVYSVTATDGAGNTTTLERSYVVQPPTRHWDAAAQPLGATSWKGVGIIGSTVGQTVRMPARGSNARVSGSVLVRNAGTHADAVTVTGTPGNGSFDVRYYAGSTDITRRVVAGTYRTSSLAPGASTRLRVVVVRKDGTPPGRQRTVVIRTASAASPPALDRVAFLVTARR